MLLFVLLLSRCAYTQSENSNDSDDDMTTNRKNRRQQKTNMRCTQSNEKYAFASVSFSFFVSLSVYIWFLCSSAMELLLFCPVRRYFFSNLLCLLFSEQLPYTLSFDWFCWFICCICAWRQWQQEREKWFGQKNVNTYMPTAELITLWPITFRKLHSQSRWIFICFFLSISFWFPIRFVWVTILCSQQLSTSEFRSEKVPTQNTFTLCSGIFPDSMFFISSKYHDSMQNIKWNRLRLFCSVYSTCHASMRNLFFSYATVFT